MFARRHPQPRFLLLPFVRRDEERAVSVEESQGPDTLPALLSRRLREVPELHQPARRDRFSQGGEQARVEPGPWAGAHGKALGLDEGFEFGLEEGERLRAEGRTNLRRKVTERAGPLLETDALKGRGGGFELRELFGRDRDEPANGVRPEAPVALGVVRIHEIEGPERRPDRVPHAFGGPPADGETGLNVVQGQSAGRPLEAHRESHEVLYPFVTHCAVCLTI